MSTERDDLPNLFITAVLSVILFFTVLMCKKKDTAYEKWEREQRSIEERKTLPYPSP